MLTRALLMALLFLTTSPQIQPQARLPVHVESLLYPPLARQARIQGTVVFKAEIAADGSVSIPTRSSGHPLLVHAAEENLTKWRFQAGEEQQMEITYQFKLGTKPTRFPATQCQFDLPNSVTVTADPLPVKTIQ
jgi:TonB family protein